VVKERPDGLALTKSRLSDLPSAACVSPGRGSRAPSCFRKTNIRASSTPRTPRRRATYGASSCVRHRGSQGSAHDIVAVHTQCDVTKQLKEGFVTRYERSTRFAPRSISRVGKDGFWQAQVLFKVLDQKFDKTVKTYIVH